MVVDHKLPLLAMSQRISGPATGAPSANDKVEDLKKSLLVSIIVKYHYVVCLISLNHQKAQHPTQFLELTRIKFKGDTHVFDVMLELGNLIHDACNSCGIDGFLKPMGHLLSI